jgi:hypothetical protein
MNLTIGEQQLEMASGGAIAATNTSTDGVRIMYLAALEDGQRCASKFFDFVQASSASTFEYLDWTSRGKSVAELAELTTRYIQHQSYILSRSASELMAHRERKYPPDVLSKSRPS